MSINSSSNNPNKGVWNSAKRTMSNCCARTVTSSKNAKTTIKIQHVKNNIHNRKKTFGVEYMELVGNSASGEALEACVDRAREDICLLEGKIQKYKGTIAINKQNLDRRL